MMQIISRREHYLEISHFWGNYNQSTLAKYKLLFKIKVELCSYEMCVCVCVSGRGGGGGGGLD